MKLDKHFEKFHTNIKLNADREERIKSAYRNLQTFVENDGPLSEAKLDLFLQGSFAINTATRPCQEGKEFDVDAVIVLNLALRPSDKQNPKEVIAWVASRLRENPYYEGKVRERPRCVRIEYAGDFHLDVVPARLSGNTSGTLEVPDKKGGRWRPSNPKGYVAWATQVDLESNGKFSRITKMLRRWRDIKFGPESSPKSILFTTLIGKHMATGYSSDAEALVITMERLANYLENQHSVPVVSNPALPEENLARDWSQDHFDLFKERFKAATEKARKALDEEDKEKSIKLWIDLFGEAFPKLTEEDARAMAEATKAATAYVSSSGKLSIGKPKNDGTLIREHRFYGDSRRDTKSRS